MRPHNCTPLSDVSNFLSTSCICVEYKDIQKESFDDEIDDFEETMCDFDEVEEVFPDHLLMGKRLRKTLYAGNISDLDEPPDYPPIALTDLALQLFSKAVPNDGLDRLDMDYVSSVSEATKVSPCAMIVAMIYLERLQLKNSEYLEVVSPSGLFVVTMLVASKFLFEDEDDIVTNQMWAEALDFDVKDLNNLEHDFLDAIDWKIFIDSSDYFNYLCKIEKMIATKQSSLRDWLSYSDACVMLHDAAFRSFCTCCFKRIMKAMVLWTVGYVATSLAINNVGIALYKLQNGKNELMRLPEINATMESENPVQSAMKSFKLSSEISKNSDKIDFSNYLGICENFNGPESEDTQKVFHPVDHQMYNPYVSKQAYLSTRFKLSKILLLDKLRTSLGSYTAHSLRLMNNSNSYYNTPCNQNVNCISLLM